MSKKDKKSKAVEPVETHKAKKSSKTPKAKDRSGDQGSEKVQIKRTDYHKAHEVLTASERARKNSARGGVFAILADAGITDRSDRIELAKVLLNLGENGLESYSELTLIEMEDLFFALRSWSAVQELRLALGILQKEAEVLLTVPELAHRGNDAEEPEDGPDE